MDRSILNRTVEDIWLDDCMSPKRTSVTPVLFIVENIARYEDGSNGLEYYPHVIRDIIRVENAVDASSGSSTIQMPGVWDGEDLRLVLALEWSTIFISTEIVLVSLWNRTIGVFLLLEHYLLLQLLALLPCLLDEEMVTD